MSSSKILEGGEAHAEIKLFYLPYAPARPFTNTEKRYILMKKFVSMFLALVMCLTLAAPAFAADNDPHLEEVKKAI